jgi:hypothetical protein
MTTILVQNRNNIFRNPEPENVMSVNAKLPAPPYTHTAYLFIRTGVRRGRVYGYWKDGGRFRPDNGDNPVAFIDMLPRGGWDGRIKFVKFGDPAPENEPREAQRPGETEDEAEDENIET